jgi:predicted dehydrogenase
MTQADAQNASLGIAFAGGGLVAELHQRALELLPQARLLGLYDPQPEIRKHRTREWGCREYRSFDDLLGDPEVEAVMVLAPFAVHEELALAALSAQKHVLVEKPTASLDGIRRLQECAANHGVMCMPGHNYAYEPAFRQVLSLVRSQSLGKIRAGWITYILRHPEEVAARYAGVLEEVMVHHTYLALALFGSPDQVYAGRMTPDWVALPQEDQAWMTWEYANGCSVHLFCSLAVDDNTNDPWMFVVKALGTQGSATYNWRSAIIMRPLGTLPLGIPAYEDSFVHQAAAFVAATSGEAQAIVSSLDSAYEVARLLALAEEAAATGRGVAA